MQSAIKAKMKKNTKIKTKRIESEILITMRTMVYLLGYKREMKGGKNY
jgi:hypothetical protein